MGGWEGLTTPSTVAEMPRPGVISKEEEEGRGRRRPLACLSMAWRGGWVGGWRRRSILVCWE